MRLFYSWQSDTPRAINHALIRAALDDAVAELREAVSTEEAARSAKILVESDTQNVPGSPNIVATILDKIDAADVIVGDLTLVGTTEAGKRMPNANVVFELGYAQARHGDGCFVNVMNDHFGDPAELPFDFQGRRWPLCFTLAPGASAADRKRQRAQLTKSFKPILLDRLATRPVAERDKHTPVGSTTNPAVFWTGLADLLPVDDVRRLVNTEIDTSQPLGYLRIVPVNASVPLNPADVADPDLVGVRPFMFEAGRTFTRNRHGALNAVIDGAGKLAALTQVFKSRELWGTVELRLPLHHDDSRLWFPLDDYATRFTQHLEGHLACARRLLGEDAAVRIETGIVNAGRLVVASDQRHWGNDQFVADPVWRTETTLSTIDVGETSTAVMTAICAEAGVVYRPAPPASDTVEAAWLD